MEGRHGEAEARPLTAPLQTAIRRGASILLDTSTLLYYFGPPSALRDVAGVLVDDFVGNGRNQGVISAVSALELMVGPIRLGDAEQVQRCLEFLRFFPNLAIQSVELSVAVEAATLRARLGFAAPDSLIIASGLVAGVSYLITNDLEWTRRLGGFTDRFTVIQLEKFSPSTPPA